MVNQKFIDGGAFIGKRPTDFAGGTLPFEVRVVDSDWNKEPYYPTGEKQFGINGDKLNCVTQSNHNDIELQLNQMIADNTIPVGHLDWLSQKGYLDSMGKVNTSEKFNSILNGTAQLRGNYLWRVADDARKNGLIPQTMLPEVVDEDWDTYYNPDQITPEMMELGKEFITWFAISYEWITDHSLDNLVKQLQHAPIQIVFPNHAVVEIKSKQELLDYFDSYNPWVKERLQSSITAYLKLIINPIINDDTIMTNVKILKLENASDIYIGVPVKSESAMISYLDNYGISYNLLPDGSLDWDSVDIGGSIKLNN